jgi:cellulose synthase (UDP-forming)
MNGGHPVSTAWSAPALPHPPDDHERDLYFARRFRWLFALSVVAALGILYSATVFSFAQPGFIFYLPVVVLTAAYLAVSLIVNVGSRDFSAAAHRRSVDGWAPARYPSVDVLLPICGEDLSVLRNSWRHVGALDWPGRLTVYVLDDGADERARRIAESLGFAYLTRPDRGWFKKSGNLRFGYERSDGEFLLVLDADFAPRSDALHELMPYMSEGVAIVQSPQYFRTLDSQGWLERGAGAVQEFFYRVVQVSRGWHDGAICVGTNALYRRAALDQNGGTTLIEHSEDVHTGFDLRALGWDLVYVPVNVAAGLCPDRVDAFFRQQYRWCTGSMSLLASQKFRREDMGRVTRCCYFSGFLYYVFTAASVIAAPLCGLALLLTFPEGVRLTNYVALAPGLFLAFVAYPLWHRCRYGPEVWSVKLLYGWAHLFALKDALRRRSMGWQPTGGAGSRATTLRVGVALWSGGTALALLSAGVWRALTEDRPLDFAPVIALSGLYLLTVLRLFAPTGRISARVRRPVRVAVASALLVLSTAPVAVARPLPEGRFFAVSANEQDFPRWRAALGPMRGRHTFQAWGIGKDPRVVLAADRRFGTMPIVSWEPWLPPPLGTQDQGRPQPKYSNQAIAEGRQDDYVRRWARAIRDFRRPVVLRFAHEMQGAWYPWSRDAAAYRRAWRHVWNVFRAAKARNVVWLWSPNSNVGQTDTAALMSMAAYWPGARYVDAVGLTSLTFDGAARPGMFAQRLRLMSQTYGKPGVLAEVNVVYEARRAWTNELRATLRKDRAIRGVVWSQQTSRGVRRHAHKAYMDWAGWDDAAVRPMLRATIREMQAR